MRGRRVEGCLLVLNCTIVWTVLVSAFRVEEREEARFWEREDNYVLSKLEKSRWGYRCWAFWFINKET